MNDDASWLALKPPKSVTEIKALPEYQRVLDVLRKLSRKQRLYLDCLVDAQLDPEAARKLLKERHGYGTQQMTINKWMHGDAVFAEAVTAMQNFLLSGLALSKAAILAKLNKLADDTRRLVPYTSKSGDSHMRPVDASAAHAALMTLAKTTGVLADASDKAPPVRQLPQIIVQVTGNATVRTSEVIDGELEESPK